MSHLSYTSIQIGQPKNIPRPCISICLISFGVILH